MGKIESATFSGNAVSKKLDIDGCLLQESVFPTHFVCKFLYKNLEILRFPNQTRITRISRCIKNFEKLNSLILPYNTKLKSDGIPHEILSLHYRKKLKIFDIRGNKNLFEIFSWRGENIDLCKKDLESIKNVSKPSCQHGNTIFKG